MERVYRYSIGAKYNLVTYNPRRKSECLLERMTSQRLTTPLDPGLPRRRSTPSHQPEHAPEPRAMIRNCAPSLLSALGV